LLEAIRYDGVAAARVQTGTTRHVCGTGYHTNHTGERVLVVR
jgi:hypothetical protein